MTWPSWLCALALEADALELHTHRPDFAWIINIIRSPAEVQEYGCCVREVAMTGGLSIGTVTGTIRKLRLNC